MEIRMEVRARLRVKVRMEAEWVPSIYLVEIINNCVRRKGKEIE
jgi:hypothetical protein